MKNSAKCKKNIKTPLFKRLSVILAFFVVCQAAVWGVDWSSASDASPVYTDTTDVRLTADGINLTSLEVHRSLLRDVVLTINLNGHDITIDYLKLGDGSGSGGKIKFTGSGNVTVKTLDTTTDVIYGTGKDVNLDSGVTFKITDYWYTGNYSNSNDKGGFSGTGSVVIDGVVQVNAGNTSFDTKYLNVGNDIVLSGTSANLAAIDATRTLTETSYEWNGSAADSDWTNPANWTPNGTPNRLSNVTIKDVSSLPVIANGSGTIELKTLLIEENASLTVGTGSSLSVSGTVTNRGTLDCPEVSANSLFSSGTIQNISNLTVSENIGSSTDRLRGTFSYANDANISATSIYTSCDIVSGNKLTVLCDGFDNTGKFVMNDSGSSITAFSMIGNSNDASKFQKIYLQGFNHTIGAGQHAVHLYLGNATAQEVEASNGDGRILEIKGGEIGKLTWTSAVSSVLSIAEDTTIKQISISGGSGTDEELTVSGTGTITTNQNNSGLQYLKFAAASTPLVTGGSFEITDSVPYNDGEFPSGWVDGSTEYTWNGGTSTDWFKGSNWDEKVVPTTGKKITIPAGCSNYPKISASGGTARTIETGDFVILGGSFESEGSVTVNGDLSVSGATTFTQKGDLSVTGSGTVSGTAQFSINQSDNASTVFSSTLVFSNAGGGINTGKAGSTLTVGSGGITFPSGLSWLSLGGIIDSAGKTIINKDFALASDLEFKDDVEIGADLSSAKTNNKSIIFDGKVDFQSHDLSVGDSSKSVSLEFKDQVSNLKDLTVYGGLKIQKSMDAVTITVNAPGKTVTVNDTCTITTSFSLNGASGTNNELTVEGAGKFVLPADYSEISGNYIKITSATAPKVLDSSDKECFAVALNSVPGSNFPQGWIDGDTTFVWVGKTDSDWSTTTNWAGGLYPGAGDITKTVVIAKNTSPVIDNDLKCKTFDIKDSMAPSVLNKEIQFTELTFGTGSGLTYNSGTLYYSGTTADLTSQLDLTLSGTVLIKTGTKSIDLEKITFTSAPSVEIQGKVTLGTSASSADLGVLTVTSGTLTSTKDISLTGNFTISGTTALSGDITFKGNTEQTFSPNGQVFESIITESGAIVKQTGNIVIHKNLNNGGTYSVASGKVTLSGKEDSQITGVYSFPALEIVNDQDAVKTVTLPASNRTDGKGLNVTGQFKVSGKEFSDSGVTKKNIVLTASGTPGSTDTTWWYLENAGSVSVSNCDIRFAYSENDISGSVTSSVDYKTSDGAYTTYHWFAEHPYYWYGASGDHKWSTAGNWSTDSTGSQALTGGAPRYSDETAKIYIKKGITTETSKQLELDNDIDVLVFDIGSGFRVNLKNKKITAKTITNNGILVLDGTIESPLNFKTGGSISHDADSVVEFNGWSSSPIATTYQGLGLNVAAPGVSAFKNLKIVGTGTIDFTSKIPAVNVSGTTDCSGAITVKSSSLTFNGDVSGDNDLTFNGGVTFNCDNVTTTGKKQIYENAVTLKKNIEFISSEITFKGNVTGIAAGPNDAQGNPTQIVYQLSLDTPEILTPSAVAFDCKVKTLQDISFTGTSAVTFKKSVETDNKDITFSTDVTLSGGSVDSGTGEQLYNNPLTLGADAELTGAKITLKDKTEGSYNFVVDGPCVFDSSSSDTVVTTDKTQTYKNTITLSNDVSLTGSEIIFVGTVTGLFNLSVTGKTTIDGGTVTTTGKNQTYSGDIVLGNSTELTGAVITLGKETPLPGGGYQRTSVSGKTVTPAGGTPYLDLKDLKINASTKAELFGSVGVAKLDMNGDADFNTVTLSNKGVFTLYADKTVSFYGDFSQTGTGKNHIKGSLKSTGTDKISFATDVYFAGSPALALSFGGASDPASGSSISISENLIVALTTGKELKIDSSLKAKNIVLYGGKLSVNQNIESDKDIILFGSNYVEGGAAPSVSGEYKYNKFRPASDSQVQYTLYGTDKFPDDTSLPAKSGELSVASGKVLKVGKNFYANGLNLYGAGEWYLDCGENSDPHVCFIEAYKCDIKNSVVRLFANGSSTEDSEKTCGMAQDCTGSLPADGNRNWDFSDFNIVSVTTVNDSVLRVELSQKMRNLYGELKNNISSIYFNNDSNEEGFLSIYKDYHFDAATKTWVSTILGNNEETDVFFIKTQDDADSRWNTDACGDGTNVTSGHGTSTDSYGIHQKAIPELKFKRDLQNTERLLFTNRFGKVLKDSGDYYKHILDGAAPVLVAVRTGQETHTQGYAAVQPSYDAHNFIEFVYSEPVTVSDAAASGTIIINSFSAGTTTYEFQNTQVSDDLGKITETAGGLKIEGLADIASGRLETGNISTNLSDSKVHGFYRKTGMNPQSLRVSVAGYTNGTVNDNNGNSFKKWVGYIDNAVTPSGTVNLAGTSCVSDIAVDASGNPAPNSIQNVKSGGLTVTTPVSGDYGVWDTVKPSFSVTRKATLTWDSELKNKPYEAIGSTVDSSSSLKRIEFHVFDNEPLYNIASGEKEWVSRKGWVNHYDPAGTVGSYVTSDSYAADIFGGARPFDASNRTSGGIRYSSLCVSYSSFKYEEGTDLATDPSKSFDTTNKPYYGATSPIFIPTTGSIRTPSASDSPYFGLKLESNVASLKTRFVVDYNGTSGFVTDLAGNRMASARIQTTDTTPPSFAMALAAQGQDKLYLMFAKNLEFGNITIKDSSHVEQTKSALNALSEAFIVGTITNGASQITASGDIGIDTTVPAQVVFRNNDYCGIQLKLTRNVKYEDMKNLYVAAKPIGNNYLDPITELPSDTVTFIQDELGNYMQAKQAHAFTDFAIDVISPLYAYNEGFVNSKSMNIQDGLYKEGSQAVHDWNEEQKNFGTLLPKDEIHIVAGVNDDDLLANTTDELKVKLFIDNAPDSGSVSSEYNKVTSSSWRIWLPNEGTMFQTISPVSNVPSYTTLGTYIKNTPSPDLTKGIDFTVPKIEAEKWSSGNQVSFLFGMMEYDGTVTNICHSPVFDYSSGSYTITKDSPLFALRLKNPSDILSVDLWSFRLKAITEQRGGVTILNNVINAGRGEKAVIKVDNVKSGHVDVMIMTLDGNIIEYLNKGELAAGTTNFTWNGKNRNGREVARGLYFVRVIGNDFDETRKIMVVK